MSTPELVMICGRSCVGKTLGGSILANQLAFRHVEASRFMREIWSREGRGISIDEFAACLLERDPTRVSSAILEHFGSERLAITGFRSPHEIKNFIDTGRSLSVLFVSADIMIRLNRCIARARDGDYPKTISELQELDQLQDNMGLAELEAFPGALHLRNDGTVDEFRRQLLALAS